MEDITLRPEQKLGINLDGKTNFFVLNKLDFTNNVSKADVVLCIYGYNTDGNYNHKFIMPISEVVQNTKNNNLLIYCKGMINTVTHLTKLEITNYLPNNVTINYSLG